MQSFLLVISLVLLVEALVASVVASVQYFPDSLCASCVQQNKGKLTRSDQNNAGSVVRNGTSMCNNTC